MMAPVIASLIVIFFCVDRLHGYPELVRAARNAGGEMHEFSYHDSNSAKTEIIRRK
jgi:hypothetical protein